MALSGLCVRRYLKIDRIKTHLLYFRLKSTLLVSRENKKNEHSLTFFFKRRRLNLHKSVT